MTGSEPPQWLVELVQSAEERPEHQGRDAGRRGEREPGRPTELHPERYAPPPLDFEGASRSTAETHGTVHELRTSCDRKPMVGTPPDEAEHCAPDGVRVGQRRTHSDIERP